MSPPKKRKTAPPARLSQPHSSHTLGCQTWCLRQARNLWTPIEMLAEFARMGRVESLVAAQRHVEAILQRLSTNGDRR
jgi:hypothetical protein